MGKKKKSGKTEKITQNAEPNIESSVNLRTKSLEKTASKRITNESKQGIDVPKSTSEIVEEKPESKSIENADVSSPLTETATTPALITDASKKKSGHATTSQMALSDSPSRAKKKGKKKSKTSEESPEEKGDAKIDSGGGGEASRKKRPKKKEPKPEKTTTEQPESVQQKEESRLGGLDAESKQQMRSRGSSAKGLSKSSKTKRGSRSASNVEAVDSAMKGSRSERRSLLRSTSKIDRSESKMKKREPSKGKSSSKREVGKGKSSSKRELGIGKSSSTKVLKVKSQSSVADMDDASYSTASSDDFTPEKKELKRKKEKRAAKKQTEFKKKKSLPLSAEPGSGVSQLSTGKTGKKKGKKEKKPEVAFSPETPKGVEEPEEDEDAFIARILKQKKEQLAAAAAAAAKPTPPSKETTTKPPSAKPRGKKAPKKKLSKKEKARLAAELAERQRLEAEQEEATREERERVRMEQERRAAIEKEQTEAVEQRVREEQLERSEECIKEVIEFNREVRRRERELAEWQLYIDCGKLPNPSLCDQMNTYLHLWEKKIDCTTINKAAERTRDVLKLLTDLEDLIENADEEDSRTIENWKWVRQLFRERQSETLDVATYRLLGNVEKNLHRIDIPTADFNFNDEDINLGIWLRVQLPVPLPNPRRPPKSRIDVSFPDVNLQMLLPITIDCENMAIRVMYLKYDHLSDLCSSFHIPILPPHLNSGLRDMVRTEWRVKMKYKYDHRDKKPKPADVADATAEGVGDEKTSEPVLAHEEPANFAPDEEIPVVPYKKLEPTSSEYAVAVEDRDYMRTKKALMIRTPEHIFNLRKYTILGGVFCINALYQPPQPQDFVTIDMTITSLYLPKKIEHVPFSVTFTPPPPTEPGVRRLPEEIDEEMKKVEEELDKLIMVTLAWPQHVIFLEPPLVAQWEEGGKRWGEGDVHDLKHNEDRGVLTFRTGSFGVFGLVALRYANLPYQAWEMRPEADESVTVNITATILVLEFNIKGGSICISQLQNSPNNALQDMVGRYFKFYELKKMMKDAGIDIFPEQDAFCYVEGGCEKNWPMEKHLYYNMAAMSNSFNFAWSRWNSIAGRRNIVLQLREYFPNKPKQKSHSMVLVTPLKVSFVDCTEVSQVFSANDVCDSSTKMSSDLYNLMKSTSGIAVRKNVQSIPKENMFVLSELLISTRILSFS